MPQTNLSFTPAVPAPAVAQPRHREADSGQTELAAVVSETLRRGITAKFFATLGADGQLGGDVCLVCLEAKRRGLRIEHLIVAFKDAWRKLPEAGLLPRGTQGAEFLNHVITLCIVEFYAPRAD